MHCEESRKDKVRQLRRLFDPNIDVASPLLHYTGSLNAERPPLTASPFIFDEIQPGWEDTGVGNEAFDISSEEEEESLHSGIDSHRKSNSNYFHETFAGQLVIGRNGLLLDAVSKVRIGVSRFTSHKNVIPDFYRSDGVLRPGRDNQLIHFCEELPGILSSFDLLHEPHRILPSSYFAEDTTPESALQGDLGSACRVIAERMKWGDDIWLKGGVELGAYGILAYSTSPIVHAIPFADEENNPPENNAPVNEPRNVQTFAPDRVPVAGKCDGVFRFGLNSGYPEGTRILAVVEEKLFHPVYLNSYHSRNNSLLAQIMTSMIGGEAPIGLILANGMFKCFWMVREEGSAKLFTYPPGNQFADLRNDAERLVLIQVLFHLVRCSIRTDFKRKANFEPRLSKRSRPTELEPNQPKAATPASQPLRHGMAQATRSMTGITRLASMDGSFTTVQSFDMTIFTEEEHEEINKQDKRDRQAIQAQSAVNRLRAVPAEKRPPTVSFEAAKGS